MYAPAFVNDRVNPNAFPDGEFVIVIVEFPVTVLTKLFAVDKSIANEPPLPKLE